MINYDLEKQSIDSQNITILITAAGSIKSACNYKLALDEPAFLNIGTSLAIDEIKKKAKSKIILALNKNLTGLTKFRPFDNIDLVEIGATNNIIETILESLKYIKTEWCLINPITTIPTSNDFSYPFIEFGSKKLLQENWSAISIENNKKPMFFSKSAKSTHRILSYPFTGRILAKKDDLEMGIHDLKNEEKKDLINLANNLFNNCNVQIRFTDWLDIGHIATYPLTRIGSIKSRFFNKLIFDEEKNIIKKVSNNKNKIDQEIRFYRNMPSEIKRFFPSIFNINYRESYISYEMEYIGYPNLSEIYLFSELGPNAILRIFNSIESIVKILYGKKYLIKENVDWLYSKKTKSRQNDLEEIIDKKDFKFLKRFYLFDFKINNIKFPSLKRTFSLLKKELIDFEINRPLYLGHGDLCFNNILVDPLFGSIKLIDPKAEKHKKLNQNGIIDNFYDLSKLNHSIEGLYDSVVNNLYKIKILEVNNISLELYKPKEYQLYNNFFKEIIIEKRINIRELRLLTANLFLSMLPLHVDDKDRMLVLALIGSIFMSEYSINEVI